MILTITPNSAIDRVIFIDEWQPGGVMRTTRVVTSVGGKGLDASVVLRALGAETLGMTFAAGDIGRQLVTLLETYGIRHDIVWVRGETRIAHVIVETRHQRHSHIMTGALHIPPEACAEFMRRLRARVREASWVIAGGSLSQSLAESFYRTAVDIAHEAGVPILLDAVGPPFLAALPARPTIVKMNRHEFAETFATGELPLHDLWAQAGALVERQGLPAMVLTCGEEGIIALAGGRAYLARAPRQKVVNAAGAGDAVSAALTWAFARGQDWPDALRWAAATSAAVVLTEGTADCRLSEIQRIYPHTTVEVVR